MKCCLSDLRYKEVIDLTTGQRLGYVCDAEIDLEQGKIVSLIVPGQKSSAVCSAAMTTTFCRGNPSPDWARISFSPRSRRSSRAAGGKSGRIISDSLKKRQKSAQKSRVKAEKTKIFFQKASSGFGDVSFKERSGRFKA